MQLLRFIGLSVLLSIAVSNPVISQQSVIDSLLKILVTPSKDSHQVMTMVHLGKAYLQVGELEKLFANAERIYQLAEKVKFPKGQANGLNQMGIYYYYTGQYPQARDKYLKSLEVCRSSGLRNGIANAYNNLGLVYSDMSDYEQALSNYRNAIEIFEEVKDTIGLSRAYNNMGIIYDNQGRYVEALEAYYKSLAISERRNDKYSMANNYLNIGLVHAHQDNHEQALKDYALVLKYAREVEFTQGISNAFGNIAIANLNTGRLDSAWHYITKSLELDRQLGNRASLAMGYNTAGNILREQKEYVKAGEYYTKATGIFSEIGDSFHLGINLYNVGNLLFKQGKQREALDFLCQSRDIARAIGDHDGLLNSYEALGITFAQLKDYEQAYAYQQQFSSLKDSIFNETKSRQFAEIRTKYESEKKDAEIQLLSAEADLKQVEIRRQKTLKYAFVLGLSAVILASFAGFNNYKVRQQLKLQTLRNKIARDLHDDVGSTLSSIAIFSDMAQLHSKEVQPLLGTIGESARKMLDAMEDIVWTIHPENDEFDRIIMRMRNFAYDMLRARDIEFTFETDQQIVTQKLPMEVRKNLFLVFKEATNNLVKYSKATKAVFLLRRDNDQLVMMVRDNGQGFPADQVTDGRGLKNMRQRADEVGAKLSIESFPGQGTTIQFAVPL